MAELTTPIEARVQLNRPGFSLDARFRLPGYGITALFGPSGCGKTTLLRILAGLETEARGELRFGGEIWMPPTGKRLTPTHERRIGLVFQDALLFPHLTVQGNLNYAQKRIPPGVARIAPDEVIEFLKLGPLLSRRSIALSGGQAQRAALARALVSSPRLLLLDEPLAGLDNDARAEILPFLRAIQRRFAIPMVYVSHELDEVVQLADYMILMDQGRVTHEGALAELASATDTPLATGPEAGVILEGRISRHDAAFALTAVRIGTVEFWIAHPQDNSDKPVRIRILASDVSVSLQRPEQSSILNVFHATVKAIKHESPAHALVTVNTGGNTLLARLTKRSVAELALRPGATVFAMIKSAAVIA
ncbi:MAG: molybdenum ABC transporter ATP-binding protein [Pseudomonadota bacterium]|nr:molybdenum ABC transporter ATP-binding protein [Pseudomonadota bacterium]